MKIRKGLVLILVLLFAALCTTFVAAQETTGGLQGTVKDSTGAVVPNAQITVESTALVGRKQTKSDSTGYYRFANLPPGAYTITVAANGFRTLKRSGEVIEVGHLPSVDLVLQVGGSEQVVEVTANATPIDVTTTRALTNVTQDVINDVPRGRSFQSVIQFAPEARNEPLAGQSPYSGSGGGGSSPGSGTNGQSIGYSIAGGADSENSYLVDGQETSNIIGGYSSTNVPFEFIQEVQIKSSGVEAEHGGSLGGVVNVITKSGQNAFHGEAWTYYEPSGVDGSPSAYIRYDPNGAVNYLTRQDAAAELYQPKKDKFKTVIPGIALGGAIIKDRLWYFLSFAPQYNTDARTVDLGGSIGPQTFNHDTQTYYGDSRIDYALTQKIHLWGSWLTEYQRQSGTSFPPADSVQGYLNTATLNPTPLETYTHGIGNASPNSTYTLHADVTISPTLVATTAYGYSFQNYHDFGYPTNGDYINFQVSGVCGAIDPNTGKCTNATDALGNPLPASLQEAAGYSNQAYNGTFTFRNANKHYQFDQDLAWFKSGWLGTHNFKFGYQLNHLNNDIVQLGNLPNVQIYPGQAYGPASTQGVANCANATYPAPNGASCQGLYGYIVVNDYGTSGVASNYNHGLFAQDAWTIGKGITLNLGIRADKEYLPSAPGAGIAAKPINFGWSDKIAPRVGASWDVFRNGKLKVYGNYGVFNDMMKLNLAISSFGGQFWRQCTYTLDTSNLGSLDAAFINGRACPSGPVTNEANWASGTTPAGLTFIENTDNRGTEGVAPGLKPYRQHESSFGMDYQISNNYTLSANWLRRRLDHVIEDAAIFNADSGVETFVNVNPGQGIDSTFNGFSNYLYGAGGPTCDPSICKMPPASRDYDGLEFRLTRTNGTRWNGMVSYTYSKLRGNYDGLTSTDLLDGFGGRNAPNNSRAFDEPYFSWTANGTSDYGALPTDRPNTFKGWAYYRLPWGTRQSTMLGLFQTAYQGTPQSSFMDVGYAGGGQPYFPVYIEGRGKWASLSQDASGNITLNSVGTYRTPWYTQSDVSVTHEIKVNKNNEHQVLAFEANITNLFNQRAVTAYWTGINSLDSSHALAPNGERIFSPGQYQTYMSPYNWVNDFNNNYYATSSGSVSEPMVLNSWYGKPYLFQQSRTVRFQVRFQW